MLSLRPFTGPADAFRKEITLYCFKKLKKVTILAVDSLIAANRLGVSAHSLLLKPDQSERVSPIPLMVNRSLKNVFSSQSIIISV